MISWQVALFGGGIILLTCLVYIVADIDRELDDLRRKLEQRDALDFSHEELLGAALEEAIPSREVRERAWRIFLKRNELI